MKNRYILIAGFAGTSAFTLYSYLMAQAFRKKFKQTKLLAQLIDRSVPGLNTRQATAAGWLLHYALGIVFAKAYQLVLEKTAINPTLTNGCIVGGASSLPAMFAWRTMLKTPPVPPRQASNDYYLELIVGHVVFGASTFFVFRIINTITNRRAQ